jgi:hypothetical protein
MARKAQRSDRVVIEGFIMAAFRAPYRAKPALCRLFPGRRFLRVVLCARFRNMPCTKSPDFFAWRPLSGCITYDRATFLISLAQRIDPSIGPSGCRRAVRPSGPRTVFASARFRRSSRGIGHHHYSSRKDRIIWSVNGLIRYEKADLSPVDRKTSTGIPGTIGLPPTCLRPPAIAIVLR